jgi:hypothetical protein
LMRRIPVSAFLIVLQREREVSRPKAEHGQIGRILLSTWIPAC